MKRSSEALGMSTLARAARLFVLAGALAATSTLAAEEATPVAAGREAFDSTARFPWYDAQRDALVPLELPPPRDPPPKSSLSLDFLRPVAWVVLAMVLALIVLAAFYAYRKRERGGSAADRKGSHATRSPSAVEALGFLADRSQVDLLGEARRHYREGNYSEAIIYLFSYELVELDRSALVHLAKGKTNRQYVREATRIPSLAASLELTMIAFESVFFGRRALDRSAFEACWSRLPQFERLATEGVT